MSGKSRATLKALWVTGYKPTQSDFDDVWDSFPNFISDNLYFGCERGITAHAGGGQADAYELTKQFNVITVCASANDSVKLPPPAMDNQIVVYNLSGETVKVYPQSGYGFITQAVNAGLPLLDSQGLRTFLLDASHYSEEFFDVG